MKKILAVCLCILLPLLAFCACGSEEDAPITVLTKPSVSYSLQTTTTTTAKQTLPPYTGTPNGSQQQTAATTLPTVAQGEGSTEIGNRIAQTAISLIGSPYKVGGSGPDEFDNPGFVSYCFKQNGFTVARRASAMATFANEAPLSALLPGDLLVFCNELGGEAQFVGIYIGGDQFVSCNNPESPTKTQKLDNKYWLPRLLTARRVSE